jgi:hypothetical protein
VHSYERNIAINVWWASNSVTQEDIESCSESPDSSLTLDKIDFKGQSLSSTNIKYVTGYKL